LCLRPEHWLLCLRPTWKFINSARHPPITFAFLTCYSEQAAHISPNRKTGRFCNEDRLFYCRN
jgi:hypothetical protein